VLASTHLFTFTLLLFNQPFISTSIPPEHRALIIIDILLPYIRLIICQMTKQALSNDAKAKTKKTPVKVGSKSSSSSNHPVDDVIGKHKKTSSAASMSVAAGGKKKHASSLRPAVAVPKGWPVSSHLTYPAPSSCCIGGKTKDDTILDVDSDDDDNDDIDIPSNKKNNYLTPGNLLQQSCNGSDVFLRKRAVQSTSSLCPSFVTGSSSSAGGGGGGGPTRFLIVFPGRMSLKAPPPPPPTSSNNNTTTHTTSNDIENNSEHNEDQTNGDRTNQTNDDNKTTDKKKNPFAPTHPPHLLGKLTTSLTNEGCMELRIPLPSNTASASSASSSNEHEIVMSGRAIPLSGKYMALSFKRTGGGSKETSSTVGGGGGMGGGNNKKRGTGSIICKDVFRSVIVLGDSKVLDGDGKTVSLEGLMQAQRNSNDDEKEVDQIMLHYGGSDRALDGGGKYNNGINNGGGRKSLNGGKPASAVASLPRKDSISSKESDVDSDDSDDKDVEDDKNGDSSDTDEFVPISARKRRLTTGSTQKRGATKDEEDDDDVEELTPARKRTPRRSVESSKKISYVDKSSSDEDELDSSDEDEDESDNDDAYKPNRSKKVAKKPAVKKVSSASKSMAKTNNVTKSVAKSGSSVKKRTPVLSVDSSEEENEVEEQIKQSSVRQLKKSTPTTHGGSSGTVRRQGSSAAKKVNFSPTNDIINVDSDDDEEDKAAKKDELHAISVNARKRLATATNTTLSTNQSPLKKLSPISRGRRKKNSPTKSPTMTKDNDDDLSLGDDDPFSFL
jgi:hypothetical protein